ncbi:MAG: hypothetical protein V1721_00885 [Pseudomonadota bacterium]
MSDLVQGQHKTEYDRISTEINSANDPEALRKLQHDVYVLSSAILAKDPGIEKSIEKSEALRTSMYVLLNRIDSRIEDVSPVSISTRTSTIVSQKQEDIPTERIEAVASPPAPTAAAPPVRTAPLPPPVEAPGEAPDVFHPGRGTKLFEEIKKHWGDENYSSSMYRRNGRIKYASYDDLMNYVDPDSAENNNMKDLKDGFNLFLTGSGHKIGWNTHEVATSDGKVSVEEITGPEKDFGQRDAYAMVALARMRGWKEITVQGTTEQKEMLWLAVQKMNWKEERLFDYRKEKGEIAPEAQYSPAYVRNFRVEDGSAIANMWLTEMAGLERLYPRSAPTAPAPAAPAAAPTAPTAPAAAPTAAPTAPTAPTAPVAAKETLENRIGKADKELQDILNDKFSDHQEKVSRLQTLRNNVVNLQKEAEADPNISKVPSVFKKGTRELTPYEHVNYLDKRVNDELNDEFNKVFRRPAAAAPITGADTPDSPAARAAPSAYAALAKDAVKNVKIGDDTPDSPAARAAPSAYAALAKDAVKNDKISFFEANKGDFERKLAADTPSRRMPDKDGYYHMEPGTTINIPGGAKKKPPKGP